MTYTCNIITRRPDCPVCGHPAVLVPGMTRPAISCPRVRGGCGGYTLITR